MLAGLIWEGSKVVGMHPRDDKVLSGNTTSGLKTDREIIADPVEGHIQDVSQIGQMTGTVTSTS